MLESVVVQEDRLANIEQAIVEMKTTVEQRFDETQAQLKSLIEDVRDDIRIVAEGHVALEKRLTALEHRPR